MKASRNIILSLEILAAHKTRTVLSVVGIVIGGPRLERRAASPHATAGRREWRVHYDGVVELVRRKKIVETFGVKRRRRAELLELNPKTVGLQRPTRGSDATFSLNLNLIATRLPRQSRLLGDELLNCGVLPTRSLSASRVGLTSVAFPRQTRRRPRYLRVAVISRITHSFPSEPLANPRAMFLSLLTISRVDLASPVNVNTLREASQVPSEVSNPVPRVSI